MFYSTVGVHCLLILLDDTLQRATPFIEGAVNEPLREFVSLGDDHMLELLD